MVPISTLGVLIIAAIICLLANYAGAGMTLSTATSIHSGSATLTKLCPVDKNLLFTSNQGIHVYQDKGTSSSMIVEAANTKDIDCDGKKCVAVSEYSAFLYIYDGNSALTLSGRYPLEKQGVSSCKFMKVSFVTDTDYFLVAAEADYGIVRFKIGNYDSHARLDIYGLETTDQISALLAVPYSSTALASYQGKNFFSVYSYVQNNHLYNYYTSSEASHIVAYSFNPYLYMVGIALKSFYLLFNYQSQTLYSQTDYTLAGTDRPLLSVFVPRQSMYTFLVLTTGLRVIDHHRHQSAPLVYSSGNTDSTIMFIMNPVSSTVFTATASGISKYDQSLSVFTDCHPLCYGCSLPFSRYQCTECNSNAQLLSSSECSPTLPSTVPSSQGDYSQDNELTTKFGTEWIYVLVVLGCLLFVFVIVYCLYKGLMQKILEDERVEQLKLEGEEEEKSRLQANKDKAKAGGTEIKAPAEKPKPKEELTAPAERPASQQTDTKKK